MDLKLNLQQNEELRAKKNMQLREQGHKIVDKRGKDMGKDQFLKLLVAQLSHQDPLKPLEDREFISQMAQFSSLEQMTQVNKNIELLAKQSFSTTSFSLLGKTITGVNEADGRIIEGIVKEIAYQKDKTILVTEKGNISMDNIKKVSSISK